MFRCLPGYAALHRTMIPIIRQITIDDSRIVENFIRASGPGGQNVNKVASAVQLRLSLADVAGLTPEIERRLARLAGRRLTEDGVRFRLRKGLMRRSVRRKIMGPLSTKLPRQNDARHSDTRQRLTSLPPVSKSRTTNHGRLVRVRCGESRARPIPAQSRALPASIAPR